MSSLLLAFCLSSSTFAQDSTNRLPAPNSSSDNARDGLKKEVDGLLPLRRPEDINPATNLERRDFPDVPPLQSSPQPTVQEASKPKFNENALQLSDVIASVYRAFPLIEMARLNEQVARGEVQSAWGAYDTKIEYYSLNEPLGFYETYRNGIGAARQLWWGGYVAAGYRNGRGSFQPWYQERQTNDGGEVSLQLAQPLFRGRAIDAQRVELFQAQLRRQAVGPEVQFQLLVAGKDAAYAYWDWVEQGIALKAQEGLLELAERRKVELEEELRLNRGTEFRTLANETQISDRQIRVNNTRMKFQNAAYKLALFLRDESGAPMIPPPEWLPSDFPEISAISMEDVNLAYRNAIDARPELQLIDFEMQQARLALNLARNDTLPNVDVVLEGSQDMGPRTSAKNDKGQYEMTAGIVGEVPIQRNKAFGKIRSIMGKLDILATKQKFTENKIYSELYQARTNVELAQANVRISRNLLSQNQRLLVLFREAFAQGNFQLLLLFEQEAKVTESEIKLLEAEQHLFTSIAAMQATLGLDPLDQAGAFVVR